MFIFLTVLWLILSLFLLFQVLNAYIVTKRGVTTEVPASWIPFIRVDNMPSIYILIVRSFSIGPFALILAVSTICFAGLCISIFPRRFGVSFGSFGSKILCIAFGLSIIEKGARMKNIKCVVANHNSALDAVVLLCHRCCFVSMHAVRDLPFIGAVAKGIGCIFVARDSAESRLEAKTKIAEYVSSPKTVSPLAIFPEGSTNNGLYILQFRRGAFEPNVPVQPVRIEFEDFNLNFTIISLSQLLSLACVLPKRRVVLHWLSLIAPQGSPDATAKLARLAIANTESAFGHPSLKLADDTVSHRDAIAASQFYLAQ